MNEFISAEEQELEAVRDVLNAANESWCAPTEDERVIAEIVKRIIAERDELKKQLMRLADFANVHRSVKDDTKPEEIATWIEQAYMSDVTSLRKQVHGPKYDLDEENRRLRRQIDDELETHLVLSTELEHVRKTLEPFCENTSAPAMAEEIIELFKRENVEHAEEVDPNSWTARIVAKYPNQSLREIVDELEKRVGALKTLGDVEDEIVRLRRQIDEEQEKHKAIEGQRDALQIDNTRLLEERRAVDEHYMVEHFHRVCDVPVLEKPQVPADERVRLRLRLIAEEFFELLESCIKEADYVVEGLQYAKCLVTQAVDNTSFASGYPRLSISLPEFADACADLKYVIVGSELEFGIDGRPVFKGVHEANLRKKDGPVREDGKRLKSPNWRPFDVDAELRRQGWRGP